jgi:Flp pilus assembly protein TadB
VADRPPTPAEFPPQPPERRVDEHGKPVSGTAVEALRTGFVVVIVGIIAILVLLGLTLNAAVTLIVVGVLVGVWALAQIENQIKKRP